MPIEPSEVQTPSAQPYQASKLSKFTTTTLLTFPKSNSIFKYESETERIKKSVRSELRELERMRDQSQSSLQESKKNVLEEEMKLKQTKEKLKEIIAQISAREKELRQQGNLLILFAF